MMKNEKLLTIGIPTYNGSKYIASTIATIYSQDGYSKDEVEILISDNNSDDNTKQIISELQKQYPDTISYYLNKTNIGYDKNVNNLFKKASGKYVQILGDDDYFTSNSSLSELIEQLRKNDFSVLLFSSIFENIDSCKKTTNIITKENTACHDGNEFFKISKWSTAAVSSIVVKKDLWNGVNLTKYFATQWIHIGALVHVLSSKSQSFIFSNPIVTIRIGNPRWESNFGNQYLAGLTHLEILMEMKELGYKPETYTYYLNARYQKNLRDILGLGPKDYTKRLEAITKSYDFFKYRPLFWLLHVPILLIPYKIFRVVIKVIKKFKKVFVK